MRTTMMTLALATLVMGCGDDTTSTTTPGNDLSVTMTESTDMAAKGPGASLKCQSSGKNAFETYGQAAFFTVNKAIFANVFAEIGANGTTNLGDSFGKIMSGNPVSTTDDAATFEGKLAAFLVYAYGGPEQITYSDGKVYSGVQDMVVAHTGLAITGSQYLYFLSNIVVPALADSGVPAGQGDGIDDVGSCFAPVVASQAFIASVVGH
jgi:hypothetical protein